MYQLYYYPSNASLAPHFILEETGAPFELILVDRKSNRQKDSTYLKISPMGRIPVLVDANLVLFEAAAICLHLADKHPDTELVPALGTDERAQLYKWLMFLTNTIQPDFMTHHYPEKHTEDEDGIAAVRQSAEHRLNSAYQMVDQALGQNGPYLLGEKISVADFYLLMLVRWSRTLETPPTQMVNVRRCVDFVSERDSIKRVVSTEGIAPIY